MDQARLGFRNLQRWLTTSFHSPVYKWKVRQWIADDRMLEAAYDRHGDAMFRHRWNPPRWPYIEPMKDAQAGILRVRNLQTSQRRLAAENGCDWWQITDETIEDNVYAIRKAREAAATLNKEDGADPVDWREVLCLPTPDRVGAQITTGQQQPEPQEVQDDGAE